MSTIMQEEFIPFPKLTNFNQEWLDKYVLPTYGDVKAVVTEKIHGTNLTVAYDGTNFRYGRRKGWLEEGENFYGLDNSKPNIEELLKYAYERTKEITMEQHKVADEVEAKGEEAVRPPVPRDFQVIRLRGEFFGGGYEHPDVPKLEGMSQIQSGIQYCQDKSFNVFQIEIDDYVMPFDELYLWCRSYQIPWVPVLHMGTLKECLDWSQQHNADNSVVPLGVPRYDSKGNAITIETDEGLRYVSLPQFEEGENIREGHVIIPQKPVCLPNGKMLIIKDKNAKFSERKPPKTRKAAPEPLGGLLGQLVSDVSSYLTENRFHNVRSHQGEFQRNEMQKAVGLVVKDALEEFCNENKKGNLLWLDLTTKERKAVSKELHRICVEQILDAFLSTTV